MNKGFNFFETFPAEVDFSFSKELEKMGFSKREIATGKSLYVGGIYDDRTVEIKIEDIDGTPVYKYIRICADKQCVYYGLQPESSFVFQLLFSHLFPSEEYLRCFDELVKNKGYLEVERECFDVEKELIKIGFIPQDKSRECLAIKDSVAIYYAVDDGENYDGEGHPNGMVVQVNGKTAYSGKTPAAMEDLHAILYSCWINSSYVNSRKRQ